VKRREVGDMPLNLVRNIAHHEFQRIRRDVIQNTECEGVHTATADTISEVICVRFIGRSADIY